MCLLMKTIVSPKRLNLRLIECVDPVANLREIQWTEDRVQLHHGYAVGEI